MNKSIYTLLFVTLILVLLISFGFAKKTSSNNAMSANENDKHNLNPKIEKLLKQQVINQFYSLVDYDLDALDEYAPLDSEMDDYYKIFDENAFQEKFNFFAKNYTTQGMNYGEDAFYDRDLIMRIGARASVLRARSNILNSEQVNFDTDEIELEEIFVEKQNEEKNLYNLHIRFYHPKSEGVYEFINEACWLTDRTCINTLGWKFLGRYNKYNNRHTYTQLNIKDLH